MTPRDTLIAAALSYVDHLIGRLHYVPAALSEGGHEEDKPLSALFDAANQYRQVQDTDKATIARLNRELAELRERVVQAECYRDVEIERYRKAVSDIWVLTLNYQSALNAERKYGVPFPPSADEFLGYLQQAIESVNPSPAAPETAQEREVEVHQEVMDK